MCAAFLAVSTLTAQHVEPAENPEIRANVEQLAKAAGDRKFARDEEAMRLIQELARAHAEGLHKNDAKRIRRALGTILTKGRMRKPPLIRIYAEAAVALESFGDDGAKVLIKAHDGKRFPMREPEWMLTRVQLLRSIGATEAKRAAEYLIEVAQKANAHEERATAGGALAHFEAADQKLRKEVAKVLIRSLASIESESKRFVPVNPDGPQDYGPQNASELLGHVRGPWTRALEKLTGESFETIEAWRSWFESARRRDWDDD